MVETWEIEWNSSMIEHGVDLGTMEFIFAKGGNLTDVNYVMLNQHDDTWEPLIKAVAERDNSHPDIIRKNVPQPQQPQQPFGVNQGFVPAIRELLVIQIPLLEMRETHDVCSVRNALWIHKPRLSKDNAPLAI